MRMPSREEMKELKNNTFQHYERINGIEGSVYEHKENSYRYIFIPDSRIFYLDHYCVWTNQISSPAYVHCLYINSDSDSIMRYEGFPVRGVQN